jgi:hypothetical protein
MNSTSSKLSSTNNQDFWVFNQTRTLVAISFGSRFEIPETHLARLAISTNPDSNVASLAALIQ